MSKSGSGSPCATPKERTARILPFAGPRHLTTFEADLLAWLQRQVSDPALKAQLGLVDVVERSWLGGGVTLTFQLPVRPRVARVGPGVHGPLEGPHIEARNLRFGAGSLLFLEEGHIEQLEIFAYGGAFPKVPSSYRFEANVLACSGS